MHEENWFTFFICLIYNLPAAISIVYATKLLRRPVSLRRFDRYARRDNINSTFQRITDIRRVAMGSLPVLPLIIAVYFYIGPSKLLATASPQYIAMIIFLGLVIGNLILQVINVYDLQGHEERLKPFILKE